MPRGNKIQIRTGTATPLAADFAASEPAWDASAGKLWIKNAAGAMVEIGGGGGGSSSLAVHSSTASFPATGSASVLYVDESRNRVFRWDTSVYVEVGSVGGGDTSLWSYFLPPAPTGVTAVSGNAQVSLSWTAPSVLSVLPITDYVVQYSTDGGGTWATVSDGVGTSASTTVTGLANGTAHVFRVSGVNGVGQGPWSAASNSITPSAGDPLWGSVSLLMHFEGSSFVDSGPLALSLTRESNDAQLSTAQFKFGSQSGFWASNAYGSNVYTPNSSAFGFGTGDFTIEFWYRYQSDSGSVISIGNEETYVQADNGGALYVKGVWENQIPGGVPVGQWVHVAICRSAGTTSVYTGGTRRAQISDNTNFGSSAVFRIGRPGGWSPPSQYIDELRVTKAARYSGATITVPEAAFPDS